MRLLSLLLACATICCAQTTTSSATAQAAFDTAYWASQPPAVAACKTPCTQAQATTLAADGYSVDVPIDVWGWDAFETMTLRAQFGYTWVPALGQTPICAAPGLVYPGCPAYNPNAPPAGSILVSTNPANYPPFQPAPVNTAPAPISYVGGLNFGCVYIDLAGDPAINGAQVVKNGQTFTLSVVATPFGNERWYTLNGCQ
jgi:hypothetical protein